MFAGMAFRERVCESRARCLPCGTIEMRAQNFERQIVVEILYYTRKAAENAAPNPAVRWLSVGDYAAFCAHLALCGQRPLDEPSWKEMYEEGTIYCGLFVGGDMVARACVEKYSLNAWEVADVRTAAPYRARGYASAVCAFVLDYILAHGRTATIRTEADNVKMQRVIEKLGFDAL